MKKRSTLLRRLVLPVASITVCLAHSAAASCEQVHPATPVSGILDSAESAAAVGSPECLEVMEAELLWATRKFRRDVVEIRMSVVSAMRHRGDDLSTLPHIRDSLQVLAREDEFLKDALAWVAINLASILEATGEGDALAAYRHLRNLETCNGLAATRAQRTRDAIERLSSEPIPARDPSACPVAQDFIDTMPKAEAEPGRD